MTAASSFPFVWLTSRLCKRGSASTPTRAKIRRRSGRRRAVARARLAKKKVVHRARVRRRDGARTEPPRLDGEQRRRLRGPAPARVARRGGGRRRTHPP